MSSSCKHSRVGNWVGRISRWLKLTDSGCLLPTDVPFEPPRFAFMLTRQALHLMFSVRSTDIGLYCTTGANSLRKSTTRKLFLPYDVATSTSRQSSCCCCKSSVDLPCCIAKRCHQQASPSAPFIAVSCTKPLRSGKPGALLCSIRYNKGSFTLVFSFAVASKHSRTIPDDAS